MSVHRDGEWQGHNWLIHEEPKSISEVLGSLASKVIEVFRPAAKDGAAAAHAVLEIAEVTPRLIPHG